MRSTGKRCQVCGSDSGDEARCALEEFFPLCSPLCRYAFAENAATYLGVALLDLSNELAGIAQQETVRVA